MPRPRFLPDRRPGPPDFIGVGAEGPGADWWHAALVAHPDIAEPRGGGRALHFFDAFCTRELQEADIAAYHGHFPRRGGRIRGEWTDRYMGDGWVAPLLHRAAPQAKLVVMLSDPIERYRTVYAERMAVKVEGRRLIMSDVVDRASHAFQLARLGRYFDADRMLVLQFERCRADPLEQYRRTLRFLGVREDVAPDALHAAPTPERTAPLWPEIEASLRAALDPEVEALGATVPDFDARLWPNFAQMSSSATASWPTSRNSV